MRLWERGLCRRSRGKEGRGYGCALAVYMPLHHPLPIHRATNIRVRGGYADLPPTASWSWPGRFLFVWDKGVELGTGLGMNRVIGTQLYSTACRNLLPIHSPPRSLLAMRTAALPRPYSSSPSKQKVEPIDGQGASSCYQRHPSCEITRLMCNRERLCIPMAPLQLPRPCYQSPDQEAVSVCTVQALVILTGARGCG
jgi:hypothetical protein